MGNTEKREKVRTPDSFPTDDDADTQREEKERRQQKRGQRTGEGRERAPEAPEPKSAR